MISRVLFVFVSTSVWCLTKIRGSQAMVENVFLISHPNVSQPLELSNCNHTLQPYRYSCIQMCIKISTCVHIYTSPYSARMGIGKWNCTTCESASSSETYSPGDGFHMVIKERKRGFETPAIENGLFLKTTHINNTQTTAYECQNTDEGDLLLRGVLNQTTGLLPIFPENCRASLCQQANLSGLLERVTSHPDGIHFESICKPHEIVDMFTLCDVDGTWSVFSNSGLRCISRQCYRAGLSGRAFYGGLVSFTESRIQCQEWNSTSPHKHNKMYNFWEDGYYASDAKNYCRDGDISGRPWCYTMSPYKRWEFCDVPKCED